MVGSLNEQLAALKLLQTEDGLWRTILDDEESYEEISASCGIAAAMLAKGNPLHIKYLNRSIKGVIKHISPDGRVLDVSGGTAVMKDRDGYRNISKDWIQGLSLIHICFALHLSIRRIIIMKISISMQS